MFLPLKPSGWSIEKFLSQQRNQDFSYPEVGSTKGTLPRNYTIDQNRVRLGKGGRTFRQAVGSLRAWQMFRLGWVEVFPATTPIHVGETVAVLVKHFGFWSLNACRIVYVFQEERAYGFAYGTLEEHAEQGEERFSVDWLEDDSVWYNILAFSRPRKWQARVMRPLSRMLQKRFARDSMTAMKRAIETGAGQHVSHT
jgi:uncharacterized protein (UPF0548 family)